MNKMTNIPPPPPMPPLVISQDTSLTLNSNQEGDGNRSPYCLDRFVGITITKIKPVAQSGPNCGLAALAMVSTATPCLLNINNIFNEAKSRGFTNNGEMFSVQNMKELAEVMLSPWFTVEMISNGLDVNTSLVIDSLCNGDLILIPYDADKDHSPCCKQGHNAHWALLCGVMTAIDGEFYVAARHGKSRHLAVWSLLSLERSNSNLAELDPDRVCDDKEYILPDGGVQAGLASQFILLRKQNCIVELQDSTKIL